MPALKELSRTTNLVFRQPMKIELYSVKGFTASALKQRVEEELRKDHLTCTVDEINHVDQFIKAALVSVPAFKIGNKIIPHTEKATIEETVSKVVQYVRAEHFPSVLVPMDFSEESMYALTYAEMMAEHLGLGLTLVHIHRPIYDPVSAGALDVQFLHGSSEQLEELVQSYNISLEDKGSSLRVTAYLEIGEPSTGLVEFFDKGNYDLMVIGTKAIDTAMRRLFGTVSSSVSRKSRKPVVVVPSHGQLSFPKKIVVGFTEELMLANVLEDILGFGEQSNAFFDFIHVTDDQKEFEALRTKLYDKLVVNRNLSCGFTIRPVFEKTQPVDDILFRYAAESGADMVMFVTHQRTFAENLLQHSVTKRALSHPEVPVMIYHLEG